MPILQPIQHRGRLAALVAGDSAIIPDTLDGRDRAAVQAKCLFAIQVHAGDRPGPYTDAAAERYADRTLQDRRVRR